MFIRPNKHIMIKSNQIRTNVNT